MSGGRGQIGGARAGTMQRVISGVIARATETLLPPATVARIRKAREWRRWVASLSADSLADLTDAPLEAKQRVFKAHVTRVEIETHARCNRICSFCPNVLVDRRPNRTVTSAAMLERVFRELGAIDYRGQIIVARYSEPLANTAQLYEQMTRARALVPNAILGITTNTDYLTRPILDRLRDIGLRVIYMSLYLRDHERWSLDLARSYSARLAAKLQVPITRQLETPTNVRCDYGYEGVVLTSTCHNWDQYGTDRGGSVAQYSVEPRLGPCRDPFETFVIDYDGSVMPCCALRSDLPHHRAYVVGNLAAGAGSIFDLYAGRISAWRRSMVAFGDKDAPCRTCSHRDIPGDVAAPVSRSLERHLRAIGRADLYHPVPPERTG